MSKIKNILVSCGVFWLSLWVSTVLGWPLSKINNGMTYTDGMLNAFAFGVMISLDRTFAATFAGVLATLVTTGRKSELWAVIPATLFVIEAPHYRWAIPQTGWDTLWQSVAMVLPGLCCVAAAFLTAQLQRKRHKIHGST